MEYNGYKIELQKRYTMYGIRAVGKGALPKVLQGLFTTVKDAMASIDRYVEGKELIKG